MSLTNLSNLGALSFVKGNTLIAGDSLVGLFLKLEGDMQTGSEDQLLLEGDMQTGTDKLELEGNL